MISSKFSVLLVTFSALLVQGADRADFVFLGSARNQVINQNTGSASVKETIYFRSMGTANWAGLAQSCIDYVGPTATPLYIETKEEFVAVTNFLASTEEHTVHWTGGEWNSTSNNFQWANSVPIGPEWDDVWDTGYPDSQTADTKIMLFKVEQLDMAFRTALQLELHFYICEVEELSLTTTPRTCLIDNDLVVILDGSISIGSENFELGVQFVADIAQTWFANENNRISFIVYGSVSRTIFSLNNTLSDSEIMDTIQNAIYPTAPYTRTHLALDGAFLEFERHNGTHPKNVILIADGVSTNPSQTLESAHKLLDHGVDIFAVGVGPNVDLDELIQITGNQTDHVFGANQFPDLVDLLEQIQQEIC